jgi:acyl carrier protein
MLSSTQSLREKTDRQMALTVVKTIVAEYSTVSATEIREEHHLENDLGLDSLDIVEISMEIEEHFDISVPDEISGQAATVGAIVDGVLTLLAAQSGA